MVAEYKLKNKEEHIFIKSCDVSASIGIGISELWEDIVPSLIERLDYCSMWPTVEVDPEDLQKE